MPVEDSLFPSSPNATPRVAPDLGLSAPTPPAAVTQAATIPPFTIPAPGRRTIFELVLIALLIFQSAPSLHLPNFWPPATITAPLKATLVWDSDSNDPAVTAQAIRGDATLGPALQQLNCGWRSYDKDAETLTSAGLREFIGQDLPTLIIQIEGTSIPPVHQHVSTPADVLQAVKQLRGVH